MRGKVRGLCSVILTVALCLGFMSNIQVQAASYEVKAYRTVITTALGYADYDVFYFYKDGKRIRTPKAAAYKSSDTSIVKVEKTDTAVFLRGKKKGRAKVTCTYKGASATVTVIVKKIEADVFGWKNISMPVGSTFCMAVNSYQSKNIGDVTVTVSDSNVVKLSKKKIEPIIWTDSVSYSGPEITAKKEGTATITVKSKVGTETLKITVIPKLKLKVSNVKREETKKSVKFTYTITNKSDDIVRVGGPTCVGVYRGMHEAFAKEEEKNLKKGESATYTIYIPLESEDDFVDDTICNIAYQYKGKSFLGYVDEDGSVVTSVFYGKMPLKATLSEYFL